MFHRKKRVRKIVIKRVLKVFLEKGGWNIVLFGNCIENKLVISNRYILENTNIEILVAIVVLNLFFNTNLLKVNKLKDNKEYFISTKNYLIVGFWRSI